MVSCKRTQVEIITRNNMRLQRELLTEQQIMEIIDNIDMKILLTNQKMTKTFIDKHIIPRITDDDDFDLDDIIRWQHNINKN